MPHYADGTESKVGDVVRGKGYNIKGPDGNLREVIGTVVFVNPNASSCNLQVAVHVLDPLPETLELSEAIHNHFAPTSRILRDEAAKRYVAVKTLIEYGQCDHFQKIG